MANIRNVFLRKKIFDYFVRLEEGVCINVSMMRTGVYLTYSHLSQTVHILEDFGLLRTNKVGRDRKVYLTDKGKKLQNIMRGLHEAFEEVKK